MILAKKLAFNGREKEGGKKLVRVTALNGLLSTGPDLIPKRH